MKTVFISYYPAFLKIPVGFRESGMDWAFLALAEGPTSLYWNPAGLAFGEHFE